MSHSRHHLAEVIGERTLSVKDSKHLAEEIAAYLLAENLTAELDSLMRDVMLYRAERGLIEADAISANPLSTEDMKDVTDMLSLEYPKAKSIVINQRLDNAVIGGIKLELPGEQLDLTVRHKLNVFKRLAVAGKE